MLFGFWYFMVLVCFLLFTLSFLVQFQLFFFFDFILVWFFFVLVFWCWPRPNLWFGSNNFVILRDEALGLFVRGYCNVNIDFPQWLVVLGHNIASFFFSVQIMITQKLYELLLGPFYLFSLVQFGRAPINVNCASHVIVTN